MEQLKTALHFGADAVYGAMQQYGLRAFAGNFTPEMLEEGVRLCHAQGKRFYLTMNIFPFDDQMDGFLEGARLASDIGVDALIASDPGAICELHRALPGMELHVSTQASTVNSSSVRLYYELGCRRVILAREMNIERIRALRRNIPADMELETFVHGAACMAWSGRCLLSQMLTGRSANQGACAQPCRWQYHVVEEKRPGEYLPVSEDEHGTYIFSARDLNLSGAIPDLCEAGISSLKIEGRMKTAYYTAVVTGAYRRALDLYAKAPEAFMQALPEIQQELRCASHRESDTGFLYGSPDPAGGAEGFHQEREYLGRVVRDSGSGSPVCLELKNRFYVGDQVELMTADGIHRAEVRSMQIASTGEHLTTYGVAGTEILVGLDLPAREGDMLRGKVRNHRQ